MTTKEKLVQMLENSSGEFTSGNRIAESLGITRAAIWKNIRQLETEGYIIEAVTGKGYRLSDENDVITEDLVRRCLKEYEGLFQMEVHQKISSTNSVLKEKASEVPDWYTVIAGSQTSGRGRRSRSFYSPEGTGVYLSILVRLPLSAQESTRITTAAAVAACRVIEEETDARPMIKWVNDVYIEGRKICGILTEASVSMESGGLDWAVMGIGINVYEPKGGFPQEISRIAGAIMDHRQRNLRSRIAAGFMKHFYLICSDLMNRSLIGEYRKRSFLIGQPIYVINQDTRIPAVAEEIDDECRLIVRYANGGTEILSSGEVSIKPV